MVSYVRENGKMLTLCVRFINNQEKRLGYISVVAFFSKYANREYGKIAVQGFIKKANNVECEQFTYMQIRIMKRH